MGFNPYMHKYPSIPMTQERMKGEHMVRQLLSKYLSTFAIDLRVRSTGSEIGLFELYHVLSGSHSVRRIIIALTLQGGCFT